MKVRALNWSDLDSIADIHARFYANEFELPNLFKNFLAAFVIEDNDSEMITAGGVRTIAEVILVTDKHKSVRIRRDALLEALKVSSYVSNKRGYEQIHAFVQGESWTNQLLHKGFRHTKGQALVIEV